MGTFKVQSSTCGDLPTRATTLAGMSFRALMAIAAEFDLELDQMDARLTRSYQRDYGMLISTGIGYAKRLKKEEFKSMKADGLTKALPRQKLQKFQEMIGIVDLKTRLQLETRMEDLRDRILDLLFDRDPPRNDLRGLQ
ncbi:hypothetical protein HRG_014038 [Hirsutella rhossiliensis]